MPDVKSLSRADQPLPLGLPAVEVPDEPAPPAKPIKISEWRRRLLIAKGIHPATRLPLAQGECGECRWSATVRASGYVFVCTRTTRPVDLGAGTTRACALIERGGSE